MNSEQAVAVVERPRSEMVAMSVDQVEQQVQLIQQVMKRVMHEGEHYGVIPGTTGKPSLLKPGAEKLSLTFRLRPKFEVREREMQGGHREYQVVCDLFDANGQHQGQGVGSCSTMESKYRYRKANAVCPECGKETIIKGKKEYGGGWLCFKKQGGCGAKFADGDSQIENQEMGRIEYDNPADYYNTCLKMAKKRAQVDATLTATAASDIFTQDVEDMVDNGAIKPNGQQPAKEPTASEEQLQLIRDLIRSSAFTADEREKAEEFCAGHPSQDRATRFIEHLHGLENARKRPFPKTPDGPVPKPTPEPEAPQAQQGAAGDASDAEAERIAADFDRAEREREAQEKAAQSTTQTIGDEGAAGLIKHCEVLKVRPTVLLKHAQKAYGVQDVRDLTPEQAREVRVWAQTPPSER